MGTRESEVECDAACIRRSLGDPAAFGLIFSRHAEAVYRYLSRRAEGSAVDDLHGETFVSAFRSRPAYDLAYPDARPWLFGIATNVVHHHRRSEGRRVAMVAQVAQRAPAEQVVLDPAADVAANSELHDQLIRLNAVLPLVEEKYLDVLMLFTGPQLSYDEIARALNIPLGTVRSRMFRARAQLRELLDGTGQYQRDEAPAHSTRSQRGSIHDD
jgi:RNA polymerase sigma factor (sigma-70 family)